MFQLKWKSMKFNWIEIVDVIYICKSQKRFKKKSLNDIQIYFVSNLKISFKIDILNERYFTGLANEVAVDFFFSVHYTC